MWVQLASGGYVNLLNVTSLEVAKAGGLGGFLVRVNGSPALVLEGGPYETRELARQALRDLVSPPSPAKRTGRSKPAESEGLPA